MTPRRILVLLAHPVLERSRVNRRLADAVRDYVQNYLMPGKKLGFMGNEIAQRGEWNAGRELDWGLLQHAPHAGPQEARDVQALLAEMDRYAARVAVFRELVDKGDGPGLQRLMTEARNARRAWSGGRRSTSDE